MESSDTIRIPMPSNSPMTTLVTDEYLTTFNTTTEESESLLDGFDAMTIAGVVIGGIFMLAMLCLPFYCICTKSKKGWRKRSTTSGQSTGDKAYSSSAEKRRKSAGNVYSENESGYKSESDFRCVSESHNKSEVKSESRDKEKAKLKIEDEKKQSDKKAANKKPVNETDDDKQRNHGNHGTGKKKETTNKIESTDKEEQSLLKGKENKGMTPKRKDQIVEPKDKGKHSILEGKENKGMAPIRKDDIAAKSKDVDKKDNTGSADEIDGENTWL
ncbi:uncharacterized protein [Amphiura filiformis]|uniref:uncharacterized protein n=1 Tax=Amphiura filiformis TaxID=82378 RepID=UPI003B210CE0